MDIQELMSEDAQKVVQFMQQWQPNTKKWIDIIPEIVSTNHPVYKDTSYKDEVTETGKDAKTRVGLDEQQMYVNRMIGNMFASEVKRVYDTGDDKDLMAISKTIESVFTKNRSSAMDRERFKYYFGGCQLATMWQPIEGKPTKYGDFTSKYKIQARSFSPMKGDKLHPYFDEYGDLVAFGIEFKRNNGVSLVDSTPVIDSYFLLFTALGVRTFESKGSGWLEVGGIQGTTLGKIPLGFIERPLPIYGNTSDLTYEKEWMLSRNGNYIRHNSAPRKVLTVAPVDGMEYGAIMDEVKVTLGLAKRDAETNEVKDIPKSQRKAKPDLASFDYTLPIGSDLKIVEWQGAVEASETQLKQLDKRQDKILQLPDLSFDSVSNISTETMRIALQDARLKVLDESGKVIEFMEREISVIKELVKPIFPGKEALIDSLEVKVVITPFQVDDALLQAQQTVIENGGKPTKSWKQTVVETNGAEKGEEVWKQLQEETLADAENENSITENL